MTGDLIVPIRLVHDRWVSKYAEPWAAGLVALKHDIEEHVMEKVFEIYIRTTPERLWEAITDPTMRSKYNFGVGVTSDWTPGSSYVGSHPRGGTMAAGENLEVEPPRRLLQSFTALWSDDVKAEGPRARAFGAAIQVEGDGLPSATQLLEDWLTVAEPIPSPAPPARARRARRA